MYTFQHLRTKYHNTFSFLCPLLKQMTALMYQSLIVKLIKNLFNYVHIRHLTMTTFPLDIQEKIASYINDIDLIRECFDRSIYILTIRRFLNKLFEPDHYYICVNNLFTQGSHINRQIIGYITNIENINSRAIENIIKRYYSQHFTYISIVISATPNIRLMAYDDVFEHDIEYINELYNIRHKAIPKTPQRKLYPFVKYCKCIWSHTPVPIFKQLTDLGVTCYTKKSKKQKSKKREILLVEHFLPNSGCYVYEN